jgi:hypothetical protein
VVKYCAIRARPAHTASRPTPATTAWRQRPN